MGRCCERQKARVHCVQDAEAARFSRSAWLLGVGEEGGSVEVEGGEAGLAFSKEFGFEPCGPSWMSVLFLKQVHLQNVGAAREGWLVSFSFVA